MAGSASRLAPSAADSTGVTAPGRSETSAGDPVRRSVTITLPVYAGCLATTASPVISNAVTSEASRRPSLAATRGARSRPWADAAKNAAR